MIRLRRRNTPWLVALGMIIAFALVAGGLSAGGQLLLLGIFAMAMIASTVEIGRDRETIIDAIRRAPLRQRISPQAREATERARGRGGFVSNELMLMDIGLIASQSSYEGMAMRRTRSVSKDDDGVRPFITLYVSPEEADRNVLVRFEISNQFGEPQYVHEMKTFLRDGELSIMADHHLPLAGNSDITGAGDWDLRVFIDGNLAAVHNFMLTPSITERSRRLASERSNGAGVFEIIDEEEQEAPTSLQDLLQQQEDRGASRASTSRRTTTAGRRRR